MIKPDYIAYMVRIWKVNTNGETGWRIFIESPHTKESKFFSNFSELNDYLARMANELPEYRRQSGGLKA